MESIQSVETRRSVAYYGHWIPILAHIIMSVLLAIKIEQFVNAQNYMTVSLSVVVIVINIFLLFIWWIRSREFLRRQGGL